MNNFIEKKISIKNLSLWDENARFPDEYFNKMESELIEYFLSSDKIFKIKTLASAIVNDFDLPQIEKLIVLESEEKLIVLEGNRRLTVYKLLAKPELTRHKKLQDFFKKLSAKASIDENFEVECLITSSLNEGLRYIERKHINGNNEVSWGETERAYHNSRRGNAKRKELLRVEISKIVRQLDFPENLKSDILGKGFITTFTRILDSKSFWEKYQLSIDEKGNLTIGNKDFEEELKVYIFNLLQKKDFDGNTIDSRSLNKKEDIENYVKRVKKEDVTKVEQEIAKNTEKTIFGDEIVKIGAKPKNEILKTNIGFSRSKPKPVGLFFSTDVPYKLGNTNLRILYEELKNINVDQFPNATHDLLRSFLECSLIVFFKKTGEFSSIKKNDKHNPTLGEMLTHIINFKSKSITDVNLIETIKQIKSDYDKPYSLARLNMINHNEYWTTSSSDVRSTWARLEGLIKIIISSN